MDRFEWTSERIVWLALPIMLIAFSLILFRDHWNRNENEKQMRRVQDEVRQELEGIWRQ